MPVSIHAEGPVSVVTIAGRFDDAELKRRLASVPEQTTPGGPLVLVLLDPHLEVSCTVDGLWHYAENRSKRGEWKITHTAIVAGTAVLFGLARMFEAMSQQTGAKVRAFHTEPEARSWLASVVVPSVI